MAHDNAVPASLSAIQSNTRLYIIAVQDGDLSDQLSILENSIRQYVVECIQPNYSQTQLNSTVANIQQAILEGIGETSPPTYWNEDKNLPKLRSSLSIKDSSTLRTKLPQILHERPRQRQTPDHLANQIATACTEALFNTYQVSPSEETIAANHLLHDACQTYLTKQQKMADSQKSIDAKDALNLLQSISEYAKQSIPYTDANIEASQHIRKEVIWATAQKTKSDNSPIAEFFRILSDADIAKIFTNQDPISLHDAKRAGECLANLAFDYHTRTLTHETMAPDICAEECKSIYQACLQLAGISEQKAHAMTTQYFKTQVFD